MRVLTEVGVGPGPLRAPTAGTEECGLCPTSMELLGRYLGGNDYTEGYTQPSNGPVA